MTKFLRPTLPKPFPQGLPAERVADNGTLALWRVGTLHGPDMPVGISYHEHLCPDSERDEHGLCVRCDAQHGYVWVIANAQGIVLDSFRGYQFQLSAKFTNLYGWTPPAKKKVRKKDTRKPMPLGEIAERMVWAPSPLVLSEFDTARTKIALDAKRAMAKAKAAKAKR